MNMEKKSSLQGIESGVSGLIYPPSIVMVPILYTEIRTDDRMVTGASLKICLRKRTYPSSTSRSISIHA